MASDALPIRIERVRPIRPVHRVRPITERATEADDRWSTIERLAVEVDGDDGSPFVEAFDRMRVWWDQTTFFLFSADSWRR